MIQPLVRRWSGVVVTGVLAAACAHPRLAAPGFNVSSEQSDYSPAVRLAVALPMAPLVSSSDTLTVVIDSAVITAPGAVSSDTTPVMRDLYITALLAIRAAPVRATNGPPEPWHAIATGDSVLLADALHLRVPRAVGHLVLRVAPYTSAC